MEGLLPEYAFSVNFDYYAHQVNVVITVIGIISNVFHFSILIQKPLRSNPVFFIMLVICICDLLQLFMMIPDDLKYIIEFENACLGFADYPSAIYTIIADVVSRYSSSVSSWMAVVMAFFRSLSIRFAISCWSNILSKVSTAHFMSFLFSSLSTVYIFICTYLKFKIVPRNPTINCLYTNRTSTKQLYVMYGSPVELSWLYFFTMVEGYMQVAQLIFFTFSTIILTKSVRDARKKRALLSKTDRISERTEGLILFTMVSFILAIFPMMMANFTLEIFVTMMSPFVLKSTITVMYMLQTLNASSHGIICLFMSSKYRDVARNLYLPRKNCLVVAAKDLTVNSVIAGK